jgi:MFS family permease
MISLLRKRPYRTLLIAQVVALLGTGLATIALSLLAYDLAGQDAGLVLGTALAIKMVAYVGVAPIAGAFADRIPRRALLISMDVVRAGIALVLPFVDQVWQIYSLIFLLQASSAAFTPVFQATIPDILPDERDYTKALSLSRLAYDLESLISPMLGAALLTVMSFHWLFVGTAFGFAASAGLVFSCVLPRIPVSEKEDGIYGQMTLGFRLFLATPRLRGLLALDGTVACAGAIVIVNTVVLVQGTMARDATSVAIAFTAFGLGSMVAAVGLPRLLDHLSDRAVMLAGGIALVAILPVGGFLFHGPVPSWPAFLSIWFLLGTGYSAVLTPTGRLLRRSADAQDRTAVFSAQFALSHACWLVTYPLAGWLGTQLAMSSVFYALAVLAGVTVALAFVVWPPEAHTARAPER